MCVDDVTGNWFNGSLGFLSFFSCLLTSQSIFNIKKKAKMDTDATEREREEEIVGCVYVVVVD